LPCLVRGQRRRLTAETHPLSVAREHAATFDRPAPLVRGPVRRRRGRRRPSPRAEGGWELLRPPGVGGKRRGSLRWSGRVCPPNRTLKPWNLPRAVLAAATGQEASALPAAASVRAHEKDISVVAVAPNDSLVATASQDKTVKVWNATDPPLRATPTRCWRKSSEWARKGPAPRR
jgi:hypothetical protein